MAGYNNFFGANNYYGVQQPMFPQPNGNVYLISNSLEVANVPAGAGITAALCSSENLLYIKTVQNGVPTFLAYKLSPYTESPKPATQENELDTRLVNLEKQVTKLLTLIGGKHNDEQPQSVSNASTTAASTTDWG